MIEVFKNLYVGNETNCFQELKEEWAVIHACKSPCHQRKVGYKGSLPQNHPEYLISEKDNHLYLNIVDMPNTLSPKYTDPIINRAIQFIEQNISTKKVLIHCNQGESRAPSIALIYLANKGIIQKANFEGAIKQFKERYTNYSPARGIYSYMKVNWETITKFILPLHR
ncbi:MAG: dual specificity protein phosphatase [Nanoarchaeota archaeon]|nr:dual specificity protein phosphatase [Nanoarchaeota archaeon]